MKQPRKLGARSDCAYGPKLCRGRAVLCRVGVAGPSGCSLLLAILLGGLTAASSHGVYPPPEITIDEVTTRRTVRATATWIDPVHGHMFPVDEDDFDGDGLWQSAASVQGLGVVADASQKSRIDKFSIHGEAEAEVTTGGEALGSGTSGVFIKFSVPVDASFSLSAKFEFSPALPGFNFQGQYAFFGLATPEGEGEGVLCTNGFVHVDPLDEKTWEQGCIGMAPAGGDITFLLGIGAAQSQVGGATTEASVEFELDFGDRDHDGLLDVWEEEGIFLPESEITLDLPGLGADPDQKDVFVELDVMTGVLFIQEVLDKVEAAFAEAPASLVDNFDGSPGIRLHLIRSADLPPNIALALNADGSLPASYYALKSEYFNTATARANPDWVEIRGALLHVFRYALWVDQLNDACGDEVSGQAEGIASNDLIFSAGMFYDIAELPDIDWTVDDILDAMAGTMMHELGHTLGLRHGGVEDEPNFKPNYLSVMSYAYQFPWPKETAQGTHAREAWKLDYSRTALQTLDEGLLVESDGLDGPAGRKILFNSAPDEALRPRMTMAPAGASEINWNHDFDAKTSEPIIEMTPLPIPVDLNRFLVRGTIGCELVDIPASHEMLTSHSDWDRLQYGLVGITWENDSMPPSSAAPPEPGIDLASVLAILDADWVDQTPVADVMFADGFETGDTTAWSATTP